jgi:hypothetical protein
MSDGTVLTASSQNPVNDGRTRVAELSKRGERVTLSVVLRDQTDAPQDIQEAEDPGAASPLNARASNLFLGSAPAELGAGTYFPSDFSGCIHKVEV